MTDPHGPDDHTDSDAGRHGEPEPDATASGSAAEGGPVDVDVETAAADEVEADAPPTDGPTADDPVVALQQQADDRLRDLQRLQAEYVNYKRRVDRDRETARTATVAQVLAGLLPVLDDIDRAREHGELEGGFKAVAESLEAYARSHDLERFGERGDAFDPMKHEALMYENADDVDEPTVGTVIQVGYAIGERQLRPARVGVVAPAD